jgi:hypothetical protein
VGSNALFRVSRGPLEFRNPFFRNRLPEFLVPGGGFDALEQPKQIWSAIGLAPRGSKPVGSNVRDRVSPESPPPPQPVLPQRVDVIPSRAVVGSMR